MLTIVKLRGGCYTGKESQRKFSNAKIKECWKKLWLKATENKEIFRTARDLNKVISNIIFNKYHTRSYKVWEETQNASIAIYEIIVSAQVSHNLHYLTNLAACSFFRLEFSTGHYSLNILEKCCCTEKD